MLLLHLSVTLVSTEEQIIGGGSAQMNKSRRRP